MNNHLLIQQAISLFDLLPCRTTELQIAGDWLEDHGLCSVTTNAVRRGLWGSVIGMYTELTNPGQTDIYGCGYGDGEGSIRAGEGYGSGFGNGRGGDYYNAGSGSGSGRGGSSQFLVEVLDLGYGREYGYGGGSGFGHGNGCGS